MDLLWNSIGIPGAFADLDPSDIQEQEEIV